MMTVIYTLLRILSSHFFARLTIILPALCPDCCTVYRAPLYVIGYLTEPLFDFSCRGESYTTTRPTDFLSPTPVVWRFARLFRSASGGATSGVAAQRFARVIISPRKHRTNCRTNESTDGATDAQTNRRTARPARRKTPARFATQTRTARHRIGKNGRK